MKSLIQQFNDRLNLLNGQFAYLMVDSRNWLPDSDARCHWTDPPTNWVFLFRLPYSSFFSKNQISVLCFHGTLFSGNVLLLVRLWCWQFRSTNVMLWEIGIHVYLTWPRSKELALKTLWLPQVSASQIIFIFIPLSIGQSLVSDYYTLYHDFLFPIIISLPREKLFIIFRIISLNNSIFLIFK